MIKIKEFNKHLINFNESIRNSIVKLNKLEKKFCIVVDDKKNYIGTLTDGDIRRGLILDLTLKDKVKKICNIKSYFIKKKNFYN